MLKMMKLYVNSNIMQYVWIYTLYTLTPIPTHPTHIYPHTYISADQDELFSPSNAISMRLYFWLGSLYSQLNYLCFETSTIPYVCTNRIWSFLCR